MPARDPSEQAFDREQAADAAMDRYAQGDEAAFSELYDLLAPGLLSFLQRQLRDDARAEDLLQQTFLHLHRTRAMFRRGASSMAWAYAIARRLAIDAHRRAQVQRAWLQREPRSARATPEEQSAHVSASRMAQRLAEVLPRLPEPQRAVFELVRVDGLRLADAAAVLGISTNAVKLRLHRATDALRSALGETLPEAFE